MSVIEQSPAMRGFLRSYYELRPVNATFTGVHSHDDRLPNWSPDGLEQTLQAMQSIRIDLADSGDDDRNSDIGLADSFLQIQTAEIDSNQFQRRNPSLHLAEAVFGVVGLMLREFAPSEQRATKVAARLRGWETCLKNADHTIGAQAIPTRWLERTVRECQGAALLAGRGVGLWADAQELPKKLRGELDKAVGDASAALDWFSKWLESRSADDVVSASGAEFFDELMAEGHRIDIPTADLLESAREYLTVAKADLLAMALDVDSDGLAGVHERLAREHPQSDRYLATFHELWNACRSLADAKGLCTWPDYPIRYRHIPNWAQESAPYLYFLYYRSPPPFDDLPFVEYLVPAAHSADGARANNISVIKQNHVAHHGALGHHVQNYYAYRSTSPVGQIAAVDCASRIGMFCGGTMAEGWACYATDLMEEVGFLTPHESVSLQENRVKQAVRAIADIELHRGAMTPSQVEQLFVEEAGMSATAAQNELTKISMFPGTGMMYWYGTERIHMLRTNFETTASPGYTLKSFHDELLSHGALPVDVIASRMSGVRVP